MIVVNLFAGPGVGKSTLAADVFAHLKKLGVNVELVTEYAKQLTWENRTDVLDDQIYVFAKQSRAIRRLRGKVDVVVTDAPLLQSVAYISSDVPAEFSNVINQIFERNTNVNYFLQRQTLYRHDGRSQDMEEAMILDQTIRMTLDKYYQPYKVINPLDEATVKEIVEYVTAMVFIENH